MTALATFQHNAAVAQSLWTAQREARASYAHARRQARASAVAVQAARRPPRDRAAEQRHQLARDRAEQIATAQYALHKALVEAAAVRLATAWEVFLRDLFAEFVTRRPARLKTVFGFKASKVQATDETVEALVRGAGNPFQDQGRASRFLREYLGEDLFRAHGRVAVDLGPVKDLMAVRHAVVHTGGAATRQFRKQLDTRRSAHGYLTSRPGPLGTVPVTQFERLPGQVSTTAAALYARAWQSPRPAPPR